MDLAKAILEEKQRIKSAIADLNIKKKEIDKNITELQKELDAIDAYESTKKGTTTRKTRGPSIRSQVLKTIKKKSSTRAEIIEELGFQDDKSKQQTISNTLSQLKKKGTISLKDGVYFV